MQNRALSTLTLLALVAVAVLVLTRVYSFGQERFFTIDEYQFGHATWLVSQGEKPYVDFFEHHLPLSYVLHAPFFIGEPGSTPFSELALRLRKIEFGYIGIACLLALLATRATARDPFEAALASFLPIAVGFGLMSAIDYRADSIAAFTFVACLLALEMNRRPGRRFPAILCGVIAMTAAFMTQKMAAVGGVTVALLLGIDLVRGARARSGLGNDSSVTGAAADAPAPFVAAPLAFGIAAASMLALLLAVGGSLGLLDAAYEITVRQALDHEIAYRDRSVREFLEPYLAATWTTTLPIVGFSLFYLADRSAGFWRVAVLTALVGGAMVKAQFPYNYVYLSFLVGLTAVRGFALAARRLPLPAALQGARPLLYLVPLLVLPDQLGFVAHTSSNAHQLALLDKLERLSTAEDYVIDNAGGALFRRHPSYYFHHGEFHRMLFEQYFESELIADYRRSEAPFWIRDVRFTGLPEQTKRYLQGHYVRIDGDLRGLGMVLPAYSAGSKVLFQFEIVRPGYYHLFPADERHRAGAADRPSRMWVDGAEVEGGGLHLERGVHTAAPAEGSPMQVLSLAPPEAFANGAPTKRPPWRFSMLFEFEDAR